MEHRADPLSPRAPGRRAECPHPAQAPIEKPKPATVRATGRSSAEAGSHADWWNKVACTRRGQAVVDDA
jgi:hypothetical protein